MQHLTKISVQILFLALMILPLYGQRDCRVIMEGLRSYYEGECKRGLAHGDGFAEGKVGTYEGGFVKGYPEGKGKMLYTDESRYIGHWDKGKKHGEGVFIAADGKRMEGFWKNDEYIGIYEHPWRLHSSRGSARPDFKKVNDFGSSVEIKFQQLGAEAKGSIRRLLMQNDSGTQLIGPTFTGFENVEFPFNAKVDFYAPNMMRSVDLQSVIDFTIYEKGDWVVLIKI